MRTLNLDLKLIFSGKIVSDEEIKTIMENIAQAIQDKDNKGSITPVELDTYTESITVSCHLIGESITKQLAN